MRKAELCLYVSVFRRLLVEEHIWRTHYVLELLAQVLGGRMPITANLPDPWFDTPNGHLCTIKDFAELCELVNARVERKVALNASGQQLGTWLPLTTHNLLGEKAVFLLTRTVPNR